MTVTALPSAGWQHRAACRDTDPETFFPAGAGDPAAARAKQVCGGCPVRDDCLRYALETRQKHGVWGGMDEDERVAESRRERRNRRAAA